MEASLRCARAATGKFEFVSFWRDFHGKTMGAVSCAIVGTVSPEHLARNKLHVDSGPLPPARFEALRQTFRNHDDNWIGQI